MCASQQRAVGWKRQSEVEKSLGLEKGTTSSYFEQGSLPTAVPETSGVMAGELCTAGITHGVLF